MALFAPITHAGNQVGWSADNLHRTFTEGPHRLHSAPLQFRHDKRRVLVVDDDPTIADSVAIRLRAEGLDVQIANDGPAAVAACRTGQPDLVVLDLMLPGFDGLEVCRRIQAERPVPVLMLTARADETDLVVGLGRGADDYLSKPFSMRELVARVHALLRRVERADEAMRTESLVSQSATWRSTSPSAGCVAVALKCA